MTHAPSFLVSQAAYRGDVQVQGRRLQVLRDRGLEVRTRHSSGSIVNSSELVLCTTETNGVSAQSSV